MRALPRQHARNCCRLAHSHSRGKNYSLGFRPERALDLGNTGGNRANPSPTRPPDLCAIPVISLAAVPQQQRDREIIGADTLLGACAAGAQCIAADAGSDGKEEDRGSPFLIFPSNPSASTATAPPQRQRGRCCEDAGENSLLKESFRLPARPSQKLCVSRSCYSVGREEHTVCNVIYFRPHLPLICLLLVFLCLSF